MTLGEFEPFCERYQNGMFHVANSVLHDDMMAEDAVQTALNRIYKLFGKLEFETEKQEKSYVLRAAHNVAIDIHNKNKTLDEISEENLTALSAQRGDITFEAVATRETERELAEAIRRLSPKTQAIFKYREFGIKDAEIAETLGITVSDLRTSVFRARRTVADYLEERGQCCE